MTFEEFKEQYNQTHGGAESSAPNYNEPSYSNPASGGDTNNNVENFDDFKEKYNETHTPEYSAQQTAQQANGGQNYLTTAIQNTQGQPSDLQKQYQDANFFQKVGMLAKGIDRQAYNQFMGSVSGAAAALAGEGTLIDKGVDAVSNLINKFGGNIDTSKNKISEWNEARQKRTQLDAEEFGKMVEGDKVSENILKYGTSAWAQAPSTLLGLMTGGMSAPLTAGNQIVNTTKSLQQISSMANSTPVRNFATTLGNAIGKVIQDPQWQLSFTQEAGNAYNEALQDGASPEQASLYSMLYGSFSALIETGGGVEGAGGIEKFPVEVQKSILAGDTTGAVEKFIKSVGSEILEEEEQGALEKILKASYGKDVKVGDVLNPQEMLETAKDTAITTALLQGGQYGIMRAGNAARTGVNKLTEAVENANMDDAQKAIRAEIVNKYNGNAAAVQNGKAIFDQHTEELIDHAQEGAELRTLDGTKVGEVVARRNDGLTLLVDGKPEVVVFTADGGLVDPKGALATYLKEGAMFGNDIDFSVFNPAQEAAQTPSDTFQAGDVVPPDIPKQPQAMPQGKAAPVAPQAAAPQAQPQAAAQPQMNAAQEAAQIPQQAATPPKPTRAAYLEQLQEELRNLQNAGAPDAIIDQVKAQIAQLQPKAATQQTTQTKTQEQPKANPALTKAIEKANTVTENDAPLSDMPQFFNDNPKKSIYQNKDAGVKVKKNKDGTFTVFAAEPKKNGSGFTSKYTNEIATTNSLDEADRLIAERIPKMPSESSQNASLEKGKTVPAQAQETSQASNEKLNAAQETVGRRFKEDFDEDLDSGTPNDIISSEDIRTVLNGGVVDSDETRRAANYAGTLTARQVQDLTPLQVAQRLGVIAKRLDTDVRHLIQVVSEGEAEYSMNRGYEQNQTQRLYADPMAATKDEIDIRGGEDDTRNERRKKSIEEQQVYAKNVEETRRRSTHNDLRALIIQQREQSGQQFEKFADFLDYLYDRGANRPGYSNEGRAKARQVMADIIESEMDRQDEKNKNGKTVHHTINWSTFKTDDVLKLLDKAQYKQLVKNPVKIDPAIRTEVDALLQRAEAIDVGVQENNRRGIDAPYVDFISLRSLLEEKSFEQTLKGKSWGRKNLLSNSVTDAAGESWRYNAKTEQKDNSIEDLSMEEYDKREAEWWEKTGKKLVDNLFTKGNGVVEHILPTRVSKRFNETTRLWEQIKDEKTGKPISEPNKRLTGDAESRAHIDSYNSLSGKTFFKQVGEDMFNHFLNTKMSPKIREVINAHKRNARDLPAKIKAHEDHVKQMESIKLSNEPYKNARGELVDPSANNAKRQAEIDRYKRLIEKEKKLLKDEEAWLTKLDKGWYDEKKGKQVTYTLNDFMNDDFISKEEKAGIEAKTSFNPKTGESKYDFGGYKLKGIANASSTDFAETFIDGITDEVLKDSIRDLEARQKEIENSAKSDLGNVSEKTIKNLQKTLDEFRQYKESRARIEELQGVAKSDLSKVSDQTLKDLQKKAAAIREGANGRNLTAEENNRLMKLNDNVKKISEFQKLQRIISSLEAKGISLDADERVEKIERNLDKLREYINIKDQIAALQTKLENKEEGVTDGRLHELGFNSRGTDSEPALRNGFNLTERDVYDGGYYGEQSPAEAAAEKAGKPVEKVVYDTNAAWAAEAESGGDGLLRGTQGRNRQGVGEDSRRGLIDLNRTQKAHQEYQIRQDADAEELNNAPTVRGFQITDENGNTTRIATVRDLGEGVFVEEEAEKTTQVWNKKTGKYETVPVEQRSLTTSGLTSSTDQQTADKVNSAFEDLGVSVLGINGTIWQRHGKHSVVNGLFVGKGGRTTRVSGYYDNGKVVLNNIFGGNREPVIRTARHEAQHNITERMFPGKRYYTELADFAERIVTEAGLDYGKLSGKIIDQLASFKALNKLGIDIKGRVADEVLSRIADGEGFGRNRLITPEQAAKVYDILTNSDEFQAATKGMSNVKALFSSDFLEGGMQDAKAQNFTQPASAETNQALYQGNEEERIADILFAEDLFTSSDEAAVGLYSGRSGNNEQAERNPEQIRRPTEAEAVRNSRDVKATERTTEQATASDTQTQALQALSKQLGDLQSQINDLIQNGQLTKPAQATEESSITDMYGENKGRNSNIGLRSDATQAQKDAVERPTFVQTERKGHEDELGRRFKEEFDDDRGEPTGNSQLGVVEDFGVNKTDDLWGQPLPQREIPKSRQEYDKLMRDVNDTIEQMYQDDPHHNDTRATEWWEDDTYVPNEDDHIKSWHARQEKKHLTGEQIFKVAPRENVQEDPEAEPWNRMQKADNSIKRTAARSVLGSVDKIIKATGDKNAAYTAKNFKVLLTTINDVMSGNASVTEMYHMLENFKGDKGIGQIVDEHITSLFHDAANLERLVYANKGPESQTKLALTYKYATANAMDALATNIKRVDRVKYNEQLKIEKNAKANAISSSNNAIANAAKYLNRMQISGSNVWRMIDGYDKGANGIGYQMKDKTEKALSTKIASRARALNNFLGLNKTEGWADFANGKAKGTYSTMMNEVSLLKMMDTERRIDSVYNKLTKKKEPRNNWSRIIESGGFDITDAKGKVTNHIDIEGDTFKEKWQFCEDMFETLTAEVEDNKAATAYKAALEKMFAEFAPDLVATSTKLLGYPRTMYESGRYFPVSYSEKLSNQYNYNIEDEMGTGYAGNRNMKSRHIKEGLTFQIAPASMVAAQYIEQASNYVAFADLGADLKLMLDGNGGSGSLMDTISKSFGDTYGQWFKNYVKDMNGIRNEDPTGFNKTLADARQKMMQGALLGSVSVPIKQISSYWSSMGVLDPVAVAIAFRPKTGTYGLSPNKNTLAESIMNSRKQGSIDPDISQALQTDWVSKLKNSGKVGATIVNATNTMDARTVNNVYNACILDVQRNSGLTKEEMWSDIKAGKLSEAGKLYVDSKFMEAVLNTQPIFVKQARNELARSDSEILRMFSTFRTQQTQNYNRLLTTIGEYKAAQKGKDAALKAQTAKELKATVGGQVAAAMSISMLSMLADTILHKHGKYKNRGKDEDKEFNEVLGSKVMERFGLNTVEALAGTTVFGDSIAKIIIDKIKGDEYSKEFYGLPMGAVSTAKSAVSAYSNLMADLKDGNDKNTLANIRWTAQYTAQLLGIPLGNAYSVLNSVAMFGADALGYNKNEKDDLMKLIDASRTNYGNQLYDALKRGNSKKADEMVEKLGTDLAKKVKSNGITRLKEGRSTPAEFAAMLVMYADMDEDAAIKYVNKNMMEVETGHSYWDISKDLADGKYTERQALDYIKKYGGYDSDSSAKAYLGKQEFKAEYPELDYTKIPDYVMDGTMKKSEGIKWLEKTKGYTEEQARTAIAKEQDVKDWGYTPKYTETYEKAKNFYSSNAGSFSSPKAFGDVFKRMDTYIEKGSYTKGYTYTYNNVKHDSGANTSALIDSLNYGIQHHEFSYETARKIWVQVFGKNDSASEWGNWHYVKAA